MSILTVNIGNSEISIGSFTEKGELLFKSALSSDARLTPDQYSVQICDILGLYNVEAKAVKGTILSSVVPPLTSSVAASMKRLFGRYPIVIGPGTKTGLNILIDNPAELGTDIVAESVSAIKKYKPPIILIDISIATVLSAIDKNGSYLGCAICPGVELSYEALSAKAALLPQVGLKTAGQIIGKNSADSMNAGILYGTSAMIDGLVTQMEEVIGPSNVVATGTFARDIYTYCRHPVIYDETLLLDGLFEIYVKNTQRKVNPSI